MSLKSPDHHHVSIVLFSYVGYSCNSVFFSAFIPADKNLSVDADGLTEAQSGAAPTTEGRTFSCHDINALSL